MAMLRVIWKALTEPHPDPQALACPICGRHRFRELEYPKKYVVCNHCGETMPDTELVTRANDETARNYCERTYGPGTLPERSTT